MFSLQLRNELWKLFGKKRTYIGFAMFLLVQNAIILAYRFTHVSRMMIRALENNGFDAQRYISVLTISTIMVVAMSYTLMPLYAALVGGDFVAKEAEDGTLRMILSRPITRMRLLLLKWLAGVIFSFLLVVSLGGFGLLFTSLWYPWGDLFTGPPWLPFGTFTSTRGFESYLLAHLLMISKACTIMTLAFMFSCFNMKPASATILALSLMFISGIMQNLPFFSDFQSWFITYDMDVWLQAFADRMAWWRVGEELSFLVGYNVTFLVIGCTAFQMRDIKS
jgi:ABC-2 type transport system permease protein